MLKIIGAIIGLTAIYIFFFSNNHLDTLTEPTTQEENFQSGLEIVETTDAYSAAEYGMFTIVEFYTEACSACKKLKTFYDIFLPLRPDVAVRRIKLPNNWNIESVSAKYNLDIRATPHTLIFNKKGNLMEEDTGNDRDGTKLLTQWINYTIQNNG